jgi:branched-chain amino acid transport system ATP-binding protein
LPRTERGEVAQGTILFDGVEVHALSANELVRRGCIEAMKGGTASPIRRSRKTF